jgi:hypothetical protein
MGLDLFPVRFFYFILFYLLIAPSLQFLENQTLLLFTSSTNYFVDCQDLPPLFPLLLFLPWS